MQLNELHTHRHSGGHFQPINSESAQSRIKNNLLHPEKNTAVSKKWNRFHYLLPCSYVNIVRIVFFSSQWWYYCFLAIKSEYIQMLSIVLQHILCYQHNQNNRDGPNLSRCPRRDQHWATQIKCMLLFHLWLILYLVWIFI